MDGRFIGLGVGLIAALMAAGPARADVISGTFAGVASGGVFLVAGKGPVDPTGLAVTGSFDVPTLVGAQTIFPGLYAVQSVTYTLNIAALGITATFGPETTNASTLIFTDTGTTQTVMLDAAFGDPHVGTFLYLSGPEGSLFTNIGDVQSLHDGPGVALLSPINFGVYQEGDTNVNLTSQTINGQSIPEAPSWAILAAGVVGLTSLRRMRRDRFARRNPV